MSKIILSGDAGTRSCVLPLASLDTDDAPHGRATNLAENDRRISAKRVERTLLPFTLRGICRCLES
jgi:hypothetical protein